MDVALTELTGGQAARLLSTNRSPAATVGEIPGLSSESTIAEIRGDKISLSAAAEGTLGRDAADGDRNGRPSSEAESTADGKRGEPADTGAARGTDGEPLSDEDQREIERLKARDREVRAHEQAHKSAGGPHAGAPSYDYDSGPDGKQYAVSGEVKIDTAPIAGDPEATIAKMETIKRAALAPAEPSGADRAIAAKADQTILKARQELLEQRGEAALDDQGAGAADPLSQSESGNTTTGNDPLQSRRDSLRPGVDTASGRSEEDPTPTRLDRGALISLTA